jgi:hypothetical protein
MQIMLGATRCKSVVNFFNVCATCPNITTNWVRKPMTQNICKNEKEQSIHLFNLNSHILKPMPNRSWILMLMEISYQYQFFLKRLRYFMKNLGFQKQLHYYLSLTIDCRTNCTDLLVSPSHQQTWSFFQLDIILIVNLHKGSLLQYNVKTI